LANPGVAASLFSMAERVDVLLEYTPEMWDILTNVVLLEWFGIRLPPSKIPWDGPVYLPNEFRLVYCLDRNSARQAKAEVQVHYHSLKRGSESLSIFAGYGLQVPNDIDRERDGLMFLAGQYEHFRSSTDYVFIVQQMTAT
jgi:hypothetical protein